MITTETPGNLKSLTNNPRRLFKNESSLSEKLNLNQARYDEILLHELVRFGGKMFHEESRRLAKLGFAPITFILRCSPSRLLRQSLRERYVHLRPGLSPRQPQGRLSVRPCVNPIFLRLPSGLRCDRVRALAASRMVFSDAYYPQFGSLSAANLQAGFLRSSSGFLV